MSEKIPHIVIINGPNLNLLGKREPHIYGRTSFETWLNAFTQRRTDIHITYFQSNHEGDLIDKIQQYGDTADGIVLNAGGYTHTSIALRDAIAAIGIPVAEVHISDPNTRETFRRISYLSEVCLTTIAGQGLDGYELAIDELLKTI